MIEEEKIQFGLTPSLQSRLGHNSDRKQSMYDDLDMLDGDDESGLLKARGKYLPAKSMNFLPQMGASDDLSHLWHVNPPSIAGS